MSYGRAEKFMAKYTMSYAHGTSEAPLIGDTIGVHFDDVVARWGERDAVIVRHQNIRWSYADLKKQVDAVAAGFLALGLEPGDRIGIWSPNNAEWVVTQFATAKAGLVQVNINPAYRLSEVEYVLNKVECKALVAAESFKTSDYIAMIGELAPEVASSMPGGLHSKRLPHLKTLVRIGSKTIPGWYNFEEIADIAGDEHRKRIDELAATLQFDDPINIQFTSGTTGSPKGATLTHHSILNNGFIAGETLNFSENDRLCIPVPLYHCFGMVIANLCCLTHGAAMVFPAEAFEPKATLEAIQAEKCTAVYGVPTMFVAMLSEPDFKSYDLKSLRTGIMAGSPCPIEVMKRTISEMHMSEVTIAYGMTETSPVITQTGVDESMERRVGTVGVPYPHTEVKIVDAENRILPVGQQGELCARGYLVMRGYWNDEDKTAEAIDPGGWMHTGDLAIMDEDGYFNIVGRIKDMVIRGGENVYPREIEEFLYKHSKIEAVQIFGVPDPKYGEELCAWIKLKAGETANEDEIKSFCKGQIAHYKIPRYVRFVDDFPMTVTGKIQKFVMREQMIEDLKLEVQETA
jgi:fatty-acyl-CoA synthase